MSDIATDEDKVLDSIPPPPPSDRLSLLPNELLDSIFESAYSSSPPRSPLSKHLYPFFEQHFYRKVRLSSPRQVDLFLETISAQPKRGKLVKSLEFTRSKEGVIESIDVLEDLFPLLPNLLHLEIKAALLDVGARFKRTFSLLSKVTSVLTEPKLTDSIDVVMNSLAFLTALPTLSSLTVLNWPVSAYPFYEEEEEPFTLPHVRYLSIEGKGADEDTIAALVDLCPALLSVDLNSTYAGNISYESALDALPSTLHSLKLRSDYSIIEPADLQLRRFTQLRSLDLDEGCYSYKIHHVLAHLPLLVEIRLGEGTIEPLEFINLVSGPTRLVNLKRMTLDCDVGSRGRRMSYETRSTLEKEDEMEDWEVSENLVAGGADYVVVLTRLVSVAKSNGVEVRGTVHEALALVKDYWIEASNRATLLLHSQSQNRVIREGDFDRLRYIRQSATTNRVSLPQLDIDSPNRTQLELVKIELPERNWFVYSLRNGGRGVSDEQAGSGEGSS